MNLHEDMSAAGKRWTHFWDRVLSRNMPPDSTVHKILGVPIGKVETEIQLSHDEPPDSIVLREVDLAIADFMQEVAAGIARGINPDFVRYYCGEVNQGVEIDHAYLYDQFRQGKMASSYRLPSVPEAYQSMEVTGREVGAMPLGEAVEDKGYYDRDKALKFELGENNRGPIMVVAEDTTELWKIIESLKVGVKRRPDLIGMTVLASINTENIEVMFEEPDQLPDLMDDTVRYVKYGSNPDGEHINRESVVETIFGMANELSARINTEHGTTNYHYDELLIIDDLPWVIDEIASLAPDARQQAIAAIGYLAQNGDKYGIHLICGVKPADCLDLLSDEVGQQITTQMNPIFGRLSSDKNEAKKLAELLIGPENTTIGEYYQGQVFARDGEWNLKRYWLLG